MGSPVHYTDEKFLLETPSVFPKMKYLDIVRYELMHLKRRKYRKKLLMLQQIKRRNLKPSATIVNVMNSLKKQNLLREEDAFLFSVFTSSKREILIRHPHKYMLGKSCSLCPELKTFALMLHYCSIEAYNYVRNHFDSCLPHPKSVAKLYKSADGEPGFTAESLLVLKRTIKNTSCRPLCSLVLGEMRIKHGFVGMGTRLDAGDYQMDARAVLVFMLVGINVTWKIPIGYFFVSALTAEQKHSLILQALILVNQIGARVVSITFDHITGSNLTMASLLGCNLRDQNLKTNFKHPVTGENVYIFPDPSYLLKLVKNTLLWKNVVYNGRNEPISWNYIHKLQNFQEGIDRKHEEESTQVPLASHTFSAYVADTLNYYEQSLRLSDFTGCSATAEFLTMFKRIIDIFSSKNIYQTGLKKPINPKNWGATERFLTQASDYILNLHTERNNGNLIIHSNAKTGFLGFLACISSLKDLFKELCQTEKLLDYVATYKLSQDHLELFFGIIRYHQSISTTNDPTTTQFKTAYRKVLEIRAGSRHCISLKETPLLHCGLIPPEEHINYTSLAYRAQDVLEHTHSFGNKVDHVRIGVLEEVAEYSQEITRYVARYVVKSLRFSLCCQPCGRALLEAKCRGDLAFPSEDVIKICLHTEKCIRSELVRCGGRNMITHFNSSNVIKCVLEQFVGATIFVGLNSHILDQLPFDNHVILLVKAITLKYIEIRFQCWFKKR